MELATAHSNTLHLRDQLTRLELGGAKLADLPLRPLTPRPPVERLTLRFGPDDLARLVADYQAGVPTTELVTRYGLGKGSVLRLLREQGVTIRYQSPTTEQVDQAVQLYATGLSLAAVGDHLGFSAHTIRRALLAAGVRTRDSHGRER